jgi:hypothetical protein
MATVNGKRRYKRVMLTAAGILFLLFAALVVFANFYVEPVLRKRLHTLIIDGSDSLYTYKLGGLKANLFGGHVEVTNLEVSVDSNKYRLLQARKELPAMVVQIRVEHASIKGIGILALLFSKKIFIEEISSKQADIRVSRYPKSTDTVTTKEAQPLWKSIQSDIKDISVNRIKFDGIKLLYKDAEGLQAVKLQFDRCDALFENIRVDSTSLADTSRIGYVEKFSLRFHDVKFRTPDSAYKMKAEWITYDSDKRLLEVDSFKLQPTLEKEDWVDSMRKSWYTVIFDNVQFRGLRLDRFLRFNRVEADSAIFQNPALFIYQDKRGLKSYKSKIGEYPHQKLLEANATIDIKKFIVRNMRIELVEKKEDTGEEGTINLTDLNITVNNIVNDKTLIKKNPLSTADASGKIIGSPIQAHFRFYLDSAEGRFDVKGSLQDIIAAQINPISTTLANIVVPSVQINTIDFFVRGEDFGATADVQMRYNNLALIFRKRDEETGANSTRKFLTNLFNKFAIHSSNPSEGVERKAFGVKVARLTTQSFFGVIWQAVFAGMQNIMLKYGH